MAADAATLAALARKYRALLALRHARDQRGHARAEAGAVAAQLRQRLRELAQEFPGCLRELDTLGATEIARRVEALAATIDGGAVPEPWMAWIAGYHTLMRAAFALKNGAAIDASDGADVAFAQAVKAPPQGRLGIVVLRTLGLRFGVPPAQIAATLFPPRRPSPYRL